MIGDPHEWRESVLARLAKADDEISDLWLRHRALVRHKRFEDAGVIHGKLLKLEDMRDELYSLLPEIRFAGMDLG